MLICDYCNELIDDEAPLTFAQAGARLDFHPECIRSFATEAITIKGKRPPKTPPKTP